MEHGERATVAVRIGTGMAMEQDIFRFLNFLPNLVGYFFGHGPSIAKFEKWISFVTTFAARNRIKECEVSGLAQQFSLPPSRKKEVRQRWDIRPSQNRSLFAPL